MLRRMTQSPLLSNLPNRKQTLLQNNQLHCQFNRFPSLNYLRLTESNQKTFREEALHVLNIRVCTHNRIRFTFPHRASEYRASSTRVTWPDAHSTPKTCFTCISLRTAYRTHLYKEGVRTTAHGSTSAWLVCHEERL